MDERKQGNGVKIFIGALVAVLVAVMGISGYLVRKHLELKRNYEHLEEDYRYLEENKDNIVAEEVADRLTEERAEENELVMEQFREGLGGKNSVVSFLRKQYEGKYLVYTGSPNYQFVPILDVEMADYSGGEFVTDETTGLRSFQVDGKPVTKNIIDVSKYQGSIDWKAVKNYGIDGVMIRTGVRGYGSGQIAEDTNFDSNIKGALEEDLEAGVYFFTSAVSEEEAREEAEFVLKAIKPYKITLPVVFDLEKIVGDSARNEGLSKEEMTKITLAFLEKIEEAGYDAMLYGNIATISELVDLKQLEHYKLWFAYYSDDIYVPYKVDMWQYASDGKVDGVTTDCDVNMMFTE